MLDIKINAIPLKGTEPQIKWAKQIRKKKLEEFKKNGIKVATVAMKPYLTEEALQSIKCTTPKQAGQFAWMVVHIMFENTSAPWWVEHREDSIWKWVEPAVADCIERCTHSKTFK